MREFRTGAGPVTAPSPVRRRRAEACTYRIQDDVADCFHEVRVILDDVGVEAVPHEVTSSAVTLVGSHGVARVEHLHPSREPTVWDLHEEVKVIAHEDVRPPDPAVADSDLCEEAQPLQPVDVVALHHPSVVSARADVVDAPWIFEAELARHEATVAAPRSPHRARHDLGTHT